MALYRSPLIHTGFREEKENEGTHQDCPLVPSEGSRSQIGVPSVWKGIYCSLEG